MPLTAAQQDTIRTDINADPAFANLTHNSDGASAIAAAYAVIVTPAWYVWQTAVPKGIMQNAITYANMTPAQAIPSTNVAEALQIWIAKALLSQGKQFNLQNLLLGTGETVNFALPQVRAAFQDCLTQLPTKLDGTVQAAGWVPLQLAGSRSANRLEKLLATGTGTQSAPATMGFEGSVSYNDILAIMGW